MDIQIASNINSVSFDKYVNGEDCNSINNLFNIDEYEYLKNLLNNIICIIQN